MKIRYDYLNAPAYVKDIGAEKITAIQNAAQIVYAKPCPFCGGEPVLHLIHFPTPGCLIDCSRCHVKTLSIMEGTLIYPGPREVKTITKCLDETIRMWNRRADEEASQSHDETQEKPSERLCDRIWKGFD